LNGLIVLKTEMLSNKSRNLQYDSIALKNNHSIKQVFGWFIAIY